MSAPLAVPLAVVVFAVVAGTGTLVRFEATRRVNTAVWPWGTLAVNLAGSLALGLLAGAAADAVATPVTVALAVGVGGLGALTTMSGFAAEVADLLASRRVAAALAYAVVTVAGCAALAAAGLAAAG
jgi:CrcB protein